MKTTDLKNYRRNTKESYELINSLDLCKYPNDFVLVTEGLEYCYDIINNVLERFSCNPTTYTREYTQRIVNEVKEEIKLIVMPYVDYMKHIKKTIEVYEINYL